MKIYNKDHALLAIASGILFLLWIFVVMPLTDHVIPRNFNISADIYSVDNFYNEQSAEFEGETRSKALFTYSLGERQGSITDIDVVFDVKTLSNEPIVTIKRTYGIDTRTGSHVAGYGDRDRMGYLFAPENLIEGQPFTYWHVNYDAPAEMTYEGKEKLFGMTAYRYATDYADQRIDQTVNLTQLPGVPDERGVVLEPRLTVWVDPLSGMLLKYHDTTLASYYDLATKQKTVPWNKFSNTLDDKSVKDLVKIAFAIKFRNTLLHYLGPLLFILLTIFFGRSSLYKKNDDPITIRKNMINAIKIMGIVVAAGGFVSTLGWIFDITVLQSIIPGLPSMKFVTALSFIVSGLMLYSAQKVVQFDTELANVVIPAALLVLYLFMSLILMGDFINVETGLENIVIENRSISSIGLVRARPSYGTIVGFLLTATAGLMVILQSQGYQKILKWLGVANITIAVSALLGYVFDFPILYYAQGEITNGMAFHTAIFFSLIGYSCILLDRLFTVSPTS